MAEPASFSSSAIAPSTPAPILPHAHSSPPTSETTLLQLQLATLDTLTTNDLALLAEAAIRHRKQRMKQEKDDRQGDKEEHAQSADHQNEEEEEEDDDDIKKLMDAPLPVSASSLTVGAPPEFQVRVFFGLIPKWIYIVGLLLFTLTLKEFADDLAENAERLQEMEFFSGMDCDGINPIPDQCIRGNTQQKTVENLSTGVSIVLMFILSPFFGSLVDVYGRRPLFIFFTTLHTVDHVFTLLRWLIPSVFTYYYITIWKTLMQSIQLGVIETIISDVVPPQHRSIFVGASLAVDEISDLILPQVSIHIQPNVAFPTTLALGLAALCFSFLMPETLLEKYHTVKKFSWSAASPVRSFSMLLRYRILTLLAVIMFILGFCVAAAATLLDDAVGFRFPPTPEFKANLDSIGAAIHILMLTIVQSLLLRFFSQRQVMILSSICLLIAIVGSATLTAAWQIYLWTVPLSTVEIFVPIISQIVSQYVEHDEFGSAITAVFTLEKFGQGIGAQLVLPLYLFWSPPPHTHGPSAGGSMTYFPQILFGMICFILCVMVWQLEPPSEGEKIDYRRTKRKLEREAVHQEAEAAQMAESERNVHLLDSASMSINGEDDTNGAVIVNVSTQSSMRESLLNPAEQDQI